MSDRKNLDRAIIPGIKNIERFNIIEASKSFLDNNIPVYTICNGDQDIIKIDFVFPAGNWYQSNPLVAFAVNNLLSEGTKTRSSSDIAGLFDYYGAITSYNVDKDNANVSVLILRKYLPNILPILHEILSEPVFSTSELDIFRNKHKQLFQIEQTKVKNIARMKLSQMVFGNSHPYGYMLKLADFDQLNSSDLHNFFHKHYSQSGTNIILSGKVLPEDINLLNSYFGTKKLQSGFEDNLLFKIAPENNHSRLIEMPDAVQSAIRIGKTIVNKTHPDYTGLSVLNVILGGYFGSRLMRNIREEKGYTYGIHSMLVSFKHSGYLAITAEVGTDVTKEALAEVYKEIDFLRNELVPEEELERVKSYMLGEMVRMFDGPFAQAESFMSILDFNLGYEYYYNYINQLKRITADEILQLAQEYFKPEDFFQVVVGAIQK